MKVQSQITLLYYRDLQSAASFYAGVMGLELVEDQEWAKVYRVGGNAFIGLVDEQRGFMRSQEANAVLVTFLVSDVYGWHDYLERGGAVMLTEVQEKTDIYATCLSLPIRADMSSKSSSFSGLTWSGSFTHDHAYLMLLTSVTPA